MSNSSTVRDLARPLRRSTRLNAEVPLTVMGVDSYRGPYREDVSTITVSCHGCKYESKHDVLTNSWVMLEIPDKEKKSESLSARGLVKWVRRPSDTSGIYETAIELEEPGNIWAVDSPPQDWLTFCESRVQSAGNGKSRPFALPRPEASPRVALSPKPGHGAAVEPLASRPMAPSPSPVPEAPPPHRPMGLIVGEFHQQMEKMLFDAAAAAVQEQAASALDELRQGLREEAKRVLAEIASSQTATWIEESLRQLTKGSQESAKTLHAAWARRLESDISRALQRVEERGRELDTLAQSLSANALDRLQRGLESSRSEGVDRIVARLKEQSALAIEQAKETTAELVKQREQLQASLEQSIARSTVKIEETSARFEKQLEIIVRERLDAAREELQATIQSATGEALGNFNVSAQQQGSETETRLRQALEPLFESAIGDLRERAAEASRQFAAELSSHSRHHLESVSSAIAEVAKGIGRPPKE